MVVLPGGAVVLRSRASFLRYVVRMCFVCDSVTIASQ